LLLPIFLVYLVASPFFVLQKNPLRLEFWRLTWYYQTDFFERESVLPHHLVSNLGVIFFFLSSVAFFESLRKKQFLRPAMLAAVCLSLSLGLVMSVNPIKLTYLLPALGVTFIYGLFFYRFFNLKKVLIYAILLAALVSFLFLFGLYFQKNVAVTYYPEVVAWEKSAMQWPDLGHFLLASGVVLVLAVPALLILLRDILKVALHPSILLGILASIFSYILFYTPFSLMFNNHNSRLLFPDAYLFMAIMIFLALDKVKKEFWQKKTLVWLLTVLLVYFSLPSVYLALNHRSLENADFKQDYFKYLPNEIGEGLQYLDSQAVDRPLVLTTTIAGMGMLVPIYAQVHVYTARELVTVDFTPKAIKGNNFFTNVMSIQEKINFLRQEKINFLVYSIYDLAGMDKKYLQQPFWLFKDLPLKLIFANSKIVIYKVLE